MTSGPHLFYSESSALSTVREKAPKSIFWKADYELELQEIERMKVQGWARKERDERWYKTVPRESKCASLIRILPFWHLTRHLFLSTPAAELIEKLPTQLFPAASFWALDTTCLNDDRGLHTHLTATNTPFLSQAQAWGVYIYPFT